MLSIVKASIVNYKSLKYDGWNITVDPKELHDMLPFKKVCVVEVESRTTALWFILRTQS